VLGDQPQPVLVLKEAALVASQVGAVRPAEDLEGCELDDRRLEPRLIGDHRRGVGLEDGAGEHDRERFADADRAGARPPPALQRISLDVLGEGRHTAEQQEQACSSNDTSHHGHSVTRVCGTDGPVGWEGGTDRSRSRVARALPTKPMGLSVPHTRLSYAALRSRRSAMNSLRAMAVWTSSTPIRRTSRSLSLASRATSSCHARVRPDSVRSARRDITFDLPVSTSNASIQPADTGGSSNANALSISTMKTSCIEFSWASSRITAAASSNRKSEITGTIDVLRMKPASDMLRLSAR